MVSRIFGYLRDVVIAFFLGAGPLNDIFVIALRLPNIFRSIFGEGALNAALVPIFSRLSKNEDDKEFKACFLTVQTYLLLGLFLITIIAEILMPEIVSVMASGYRGEPEVMNLIVSLSRVTFPYIIFISLMAFYGGVANAYGNFFFFASAPILLNITLIILALIPGEDLSKLWYLGFGIVVAGVLEMLWVYIFIYKRFGNVFGLSFRLNEHIRKAFSNFLPGVLSASAAQISIVVTTLIASFTEGGISYLYYADRVYQLPLALVATALGTSLLPVLSKKAASTDLSKFHALQNKSFMFVNYLTIPAALIIFIYSYEIVSFLFERGSFTSHAVAETSIPLKIFAICLPFFTINRILTACFHSVSDTKTPFKVTIIGIIVSITFGFLLMPIFAYVAVTIGALISAMISTGLLSYLLLKRNRLALYKRTVKQLMKVILFSALSIIPTKLFFELVGITSSFSFILEVSLFGVLYLAFSKFMRF